MFLLITLALQLTGNSELQAIATLAKTLVIIVYIMNAPTQSTSGTAHQSNWFTCCFALLWVLVITIIGVLLFLIIDRERDHCDEAVTNSTTST